MAKKILTPVIIIFGIAIPVFLSLTKIYASECSDNCQLAYPNEENSDERNTCEKKCEDLENKKDDVLKLLKVNDKTQNALQNQLESIDQQQFQNQQSLSMVQNKLGSLLEQIKGLERDIAEKEKSIAHQKKILAGLMQSYYDYDQQGVLEFVLWDQSLAESMSQSDYIEQSGVKAYEILDEIKNSQQELVANKQKLESDQKKSDDLKQKLQYEKNNLESSENQKQWLLEKTQGEEQKYQDMLARIEAQKSELFNFSSASNLSEVFDSLKNYSKPDKKNWASTSWFFLQTDPRWGNQKIGNSKSLMKDYGCAVTSVAMVFRKMSSTIDPGRLAKEKIFSSDLINWPASWSPGIAIASSTSHGNVNWTTIKSQISNGHPVIVHIKKTSGGGGHYVVITGKDSKDYIVHDPYFGSNIYLGTSMSLIGKLGTNSKTSIDQMIIYN